MAKIMPKTASPSEIQRNYRHLFDEVKATEEPLIILNNNKPDVVILSYKQYEDLVRAQEAREQKLTRMAIKNYKTELTKGKLKQLSSLADLD